MNQLKSEMSYWCSLVPKFPPPHYCRGLSLKMRLMLVLRAVQIYAYFMSTFTKFNMIYIIYVCFTQPPIPMTEGLDVLSLLTDGATIARWNNEKLPSDRMSIENATILTNAERWPLMIDPQLQGIKWIKTREGDELKVVRLGQKG